MCNVAGVADQRADADSAHEGQISSVAKHVSARHIVRRSLKIHGIARSETRIAPSRRLNAVSQLRGQDPGRQLRRLFSRRPQRRD
jgi:hypothetical protein